mgnify:CR=1 FL=1
MRRIRRSTLARYVLLKDVPTKPRKEEYAVGMVQVKCVRYVLLKDVPSTLIKEEYVGGMEQRTRNASTKDVPTLL